MKVTLLFNTPLSICCEAIRTCWDSFKEENIYKFPTDDIVESDKELMKKVIKKYKHESTFEHLVYHFNIEGVSRALLQEWARHRLQSLSVKSTRYTLKELKDIDYILYEDLEKYCVLTGDTEVDMNTWMALQNVQRALKNSKKNDVVKFCLPESFRTNIRATINARSLQNLLSLRTSSAAMWEFQLLAKELYNQLPEKHKFLFDICN